MGASEHRGSLIAVDPGLNATGWARFEASRLKACGLLCAKTGGEGIYKALWMARRVSALAWASGGIANPPADLLLAIEQPQIYMQRKQRGDPNDLIALAVVVGAIAASIPDAHCILVPPRRWKGTIPKERSLEDYVIHHRVCSHLSETESGIYTGTIQDIALSLRHNVADAVGIGLWALRNPTRWFC